MTPLCESIAQRLKSGSERRGVRPNLVAASVKAAGQLKPENTKSNDVELQQALFMRTSIYRADVLHGLAIVAAPLVMILPMDLRSNGGHLLCQGLV